LLDSDLPLAPLSHLPSRSGLLMVGLAVVFGLTAIFAVIHFPRDDNWSQSAIDREFELVSPSEQRVSAIQPIRVEPAIPRLIVHSSRGVSGEPAPLGLAVQGPAEGAVVIITGMPGMELSTGDAVGGGAWHLSATDLQYAWIAPPEGFVGSADLVAELRLPRDEIADRQVIHFEWTSPIMSAPAHHEEIAQFPLDREEIAPLQLDRAEVAQLQLDQQETTAVPPISPSIVQRPLDPEENMAVPLISAEPEQRQFSRKEITGLLKPGKNNSWTARRSAENGSRRAPFAAVYAGDNTHAPKGFWDWSR
jgi:hypothetical protein